MKLQKCAQQNRHAKQANCQPPLNQTCLGTDKVKPVLSGHPVLSRRKAHFFKYLE